MKKLYFVPIFCLLLAPAFAQKNPVAGRWDLTLTQPNGNTYPQWMEIVAQDGKLEGRIQPRGGAVRPMVAAKAEGGHLTITVSEGTQATGAQKKSSPATTWDLTVDGNKLSGVEKHGETAGAQIAGVRAPALKRPMPKAWTAPEAIFNGKDLTGWEPIGNVQNSKWVARDGELVNDNPVVEGPHGPGAANIKTTRKFQDFKLHIEVNCPEHGNSGIYLRGRYEIQVGTEGGTTPSHEMGAVYGHFAPLGNIGNKLGEWTTFDITFVGRYLTAMRDGVKIHDNVEIPGPTGGALDSNESEPGPFFLQGDHQGVIHYRNITISEPKK